MSDRLMAALQECLAGMESGQTMEEVLARHPALADELGELLLAANSVAATSGLADDARLAVGAALSELARQTFPGPPAAPVDAAPVDGAPIHAVPVDAHRPEGVADSPGAGTAGERGNASRAAVLAAGAVAVVALLALVVAIRGRGVADGGPPSVATATLAIPVAGQLTVVAETPAPETTPRAGSVTPNADARPLSTDIANRTPSPTAAVRPTGTTGPAQRSGRSGATRATIQGRVSGPSGVPIPGAIVRAEALGSTAEAAGITDTDGFFRLLVAPGEYRLSVVAKGFFPEWYGPTHDPRLAAVIRLAGGEIVVVDFELDPEPTPPSRPPDPEPTDAPVEPDPEPTEPEPQPTDPPPDPDPYP